ncbi:MAG: hypothetical protein L6M37_00145 [Candidatus Methylarchaceae archaeon HK02M1]|nr:hypothetical protein [Candidatus Methylarchaceae archaeon HK02M1]
MVDQQGTLPHKKRVPQRIFLPLSIINFEKTFVGKTRLQKLAFLVQYESKLDLYDFKKHQYGPYSHDLAVDTQCYSDYIQWNIQPSVQYPPGRYHYAYSITDAGRILLSELLQGLNHKMVEKIKASLSYYAPMQWTELADYAYSRFLPDVKDFTKQIEKLRLEIDNLRLAIEMCCQVYYNPQASFILSSIEYLLMILEALPKVTDQLQFGVILNLLCQVVNDCKEVACLLTLSNVSLKHRFIDIAETRHYLADYCDKQGIVKDPLKRSLNEILSEGEAKRLAKVLLEVDLKKIS